ncbi:efflux RND transporter periplasmic adaptor subunit [Paraburkholderia sp. MMS20-SJTR3]|uniref:Efflux RND transporter periplasmic adaptor subunit n=1 Tax=Paraburkholderia sejongensis TaxID=2886946 RepID=A0ABS8K0I2_9BURK|nr:efflux RND transporter periplasmic adaptor subunit [Paraburkholderia sp. MMS20-SJTR3]MCC8395660.1 efflux RND transporter periplasmic adaptor subunit [Paraburkholderia sp. MMS20-SJTR3]
MSADTRPAVQLTRLEPADASAIRIFTGRVEQTSISPLAFEVPGRVVQIAVLEGAAVKRGQLIARIDEEPYALQLQRANAQYQQLADNLKRQAVLRKDGILSQAGYDQLSAAADAARAARDLASRDLRNTRLVAPFDGRVARRNIEVQQMVQAGAPAFNFENVGRVDIGVDLPQSLAERLLVDKTLRAEAWLPERPTERFPLVFRERTTQSTPTSGGYRLVFSVQGQQSALLFPGMALRVQISDTARQVAQRDNSYYAIPIAALSIGADGQRSLWRYDAASGRVHAVPVNVREIRNDDAVVSGAVAEGDRVVAGGSQFMKEGMAVRPMDAPQ